ncbi:hypothetical protein H6B11_17210 [Mediterraneibacter glycyrrhizinilyticus]|nr:hypothetical protein [Mediterraneibacter glycyrrhizinilyticus]MBM6855840.1 hypothetical protein [Mediterraneibacter glycyrrhizinilyticus]
MSWEEMGTESVTCPCGKGKIVRTNYGDDWNRFKESISICCPECSKKYDLVTKSWYKHAGDYGDAYYLLEKNYPEYTGVNLQDVFPDKVDINKIPFVEYLIKTYKRTDLFDVERELNNVTAVSRLTGIAADIAQKHKRAFDSAKITVLRQCVAEAGRRYNEFADNKEHRLPIEEQERQERYAYEEEKRKHMIFIPCKEIGND